MRTDDRLAVGAARALGLVRSDEWPLVAAHLLACGADGPALIELAALPRGSSPWEVDGLLESALSEAGIPDVEVTRAGAVVARVLAQALRRGEPAADHAIVRTLAELAVGTGYPGGLLSKAASAAEWLDCGCYQTGRDEADALEADLRALPDLDADDGLVRALLSRVPRRQPTRRSRRRGLLASLTGKRRLAYCPRHRD